MIKSLLLIGTFCCMCFGLKAQHALPDVFIKNKEVKLAARLTLPEGEGPFPVVVIVHGSGKYGWGLYGRTVANLNAIGLAVLYYDKRGTNSSTGKYLDVSVKRSEKAFEVLASDVIAVVNWLEQRPDIDQTRIGLYGPSQGGWIVTLVANKSAAVDFIISVSGPVATLGQEFIYSRLAGDEKRGKQATDQQIYERTRDYSGRQGFDPIPYIRSMEVPGLWLIGMNDTSMPPVVSLENLRKIIKETGKANYTYLTYEGMNHSLRNPETGEWAPIYRDIKHWLEKNVWK